MMKLSAPRLATIVTVSLITTSRPTEAIGASPALRSAPSAAAPAGDGPAASTPPAAAGDGLRLELREGGPIDYDPVERGTASASAIPRVARPDADEATPDPPPPPAPRAANTLPLGSTTSLTLRSQEQVSVEHYDRKLGQWVLLCVAPCRALVPRGAHLRIPRDARHRVPGSRTIRLRPERSASTINLRRGSLRQRWAGIGTAVISAAGLVFGATAAYRSDEDEPLMGRSLEGVYLISAATALVAIGVGIAIAARSTLREGRRRRTALMPGAIAF